MKIMTIIGARPQFIKAAVVSRAMQEASGVEEVIVHTGQHFDDNMSEVFFREMDIPHPHYNLGIRASSHGAMTGRMLESIEKVMQDERPDWLLVYGDTNSTLAGALAAAKLHIKVAHVEAGLRSFNMQMPEEINRILTDRISNVLFCPTDTAVQNLKNEGFEHFGIGIIRCGDVMYDAALYYAERADSHSDIIERLDLSGFILCTLHRAENTDDPARLRTIFQALDKISTEIPVLLPLHPRTKKILEQEDISTQVRLIDPVGYFDMIRLLQHCRLVMTDSGGLQKEACFFRRHCVTLRDQTEWTELLDHGYNVLAGSDSDAIYKAYQAMIGKQSDFNTDLYGDGKAGQQVVDFFARNT